MNIKEKIYRTLCNHEKATIKGIAHLINESAYKTARGVAELKKQGIVKKKVSYQRIDPYTTHKHINITLAKRGLTQSTLF